MMISMVFIKGYKPSEEHLKHLSESHKGQNAWNKGKKMSEEFRKKCKQRQLGVFNRSEEGKKSFAKKMSGENHPRWIKDRTKTIERRRLRGTSEWKEWRIAVFTRDNFSCIDCGQHGGYLEAHHIIPLKQTFSRMFDITNGITLCRPCHVKTMGKELQLANIYFSLVPAQV